METGLAVKMRMLSFLDVNRIPSPDAFPQNGIYTNEKLGFVIRVDGLSITDPTEKRENSSQNHTMNFM